MGKCCWKNGTDGLARCRVTTNFQFVKITVSEKHDKTAKNKNKNPSGLLSLKDKYCTIPLLGHLEKSEAEWQLPGPRGGRNGELVFTSYRASTQKDEKVLEMDGGD